MNASPTTPPLSSIARRVLEHKILRFLVSAPPEGYCLDDIRKEFKAEPVTHTLEHLADRGEVRRCEGLVYAIEERGRWRVQPSASRCRRRGAGVNRGIVEPFHNDRCHACKQVLSGRSAADYAGGVLVRLHPGCVTKKSRPKLTEAN